MVLFKTPFALQGRNRELCLFGDWTIVRFKGAETTHYWSGKSASHRTGPKYSSLRIRCSYYSVSFSLKF